MRLILHAFERAARSLGSQRNTWRIGVRPPDKALQVHCEALATRFKTADMSHMSPDKLETARRQAAYRRASV